jgi:hypothetical protein
MSERIKLDPLINRLVIFKLRGQEPMEATIIGFDDSGYWIRGGALALFLSGSENEVCYLEFSKIESFRAATQNSK